MFGDVFLVKKEVFEEHSAHSKAVLDDPSITVDTTSLDQRASKLHESHNSRIALSALFSVWSLLAKLTRKENTILFVTQ